MPDIKTTVYGLLTDKLGVGADQLVDEATLESLDLDSLLLVELSVGVERELGVVLEETELTPERTLAGVVELVGSKLKVSR